MEFIKSKGVILYDSVTGDYEDQLQESTVLVNKRSFKSYIKDNYNLSPEEYYNLIMYGDKNKIHFCPKCGRRLAFGTFRRPYHILCKSCRVNYNFCSSSEQQSYFNSIRLPTTNEMSEIERVVRQRAQYIFRTYKCIDSQSDSIMMLGKDKGIIKMSLIQDLIDKGKLNPRYSNRTNVYDYLIRKGFLHYELQFIIINDR